MFRLFALWSLKAVLETAVATMVCKANLAARRRRPVFVYLMSGDSLEFAQADSFRLERDYLVLMESGESGAKTPIRKLARREVLYASRALDCPGPC